MNKTTDTAIAEEIIRQLGGRGFLVMTGAKNLIAQERGISFMLPRMPGIKINAVRITLDPSDTYTVEFMRLWRGELTVLESHDDIYCDMLAGLFRDVTGLETRMPRLIN